MDHEKAYRYLIHFFGAKDPKITYQRRGFLDIAEGPILFKQEPG
jgi:S-adenosylmethionine/arginine decarboxylase-like enzyme